MLWKLWKNGMGTRREREREKERVTGSVYEKARKETYKFLVLGPLSQRNAQDIVAHVGEAGVADPTFEQGARRRLASGFRARFGHKVRDFGEGAVVG
jgi:hypothetical protein